MATKRSWLPLSICMVLAIGLVTGLAAWDSHRESEAILDDVGAEQSLLASLVAADVRTRLEAQARSAPSSDALAASLLQGLSRLVAGAGEEVFLAPPNAPSIYTTSGRVLAMAAPSPGIDALEHALRHDARTLRLTRPQAADLGLEPRTAMAGIVHVETGGSGRWGVAAVGTAARPRDREKRALRRLVLGVSVASLLVLSFGGIALRKQRKELQLERELAIANALRERDDQLAGAERVATMGTFAMGVVHEVSTPLGIIFGRAEQLAARADLDERGRRAAAAILQQVEGIRAVIRTFLDMARGGPPSFTASSPREIAVAAASLVEHRFTKAGVSLDVDVPPDIPRIQTDGALLKQAIVNLLLNACDACARGGHVELAARADSERVAFVVTDDGVGIAPEQAARAAEPFFTTKPSGAGSGLGLAIAAEIAKSHRGELRIAPNATVGTRACIEIPAIGTGLAHAAS
jgi:signal transduction histidine kinase